MKKFFIAIVVIIVVFLGVGFLFPSDYKVTRSIMITSDQTTLYPMIANLQKWQDWCPWTTETYPKMVSSYSGPELGKDAVWSWSGPKSGNGKLQITKSDPKTGIHYDLQFEDYPVSKCELTMKSVDGGVEVVMSNAGSVGTAPWSRYLGLFMDSLMGAEFEKGLERLKSNAES